jgi:hypothetical protein
METLRTLLGKSGIDIPIAKSLPLPCCCATRDSGCNYADDALKGRVAHTFALSVAALVARIGLLAGLASAVVCAPALGQWRVEAFLGDAWSAPTRVTFAQADQPTIAATAHWSTQPFEPTWVYAVRFARWQGDAAWAFEYMHHKIYMDNPPPDVKYFRVTNGVNFFLAERLWRRKGWEFGVGATPIFAVPVSDVRGEVYNNSHGIFHSQYELSGFGGQANLARRVRLLPFTYGTLSLKLTAAWLHMNIVDGYAVTTNYAVHIQYGLSLQSKSR